MWPRLGRNQQKGKCIVGSGKDWGREGVLSLRRACLRVGGWSDSLFNSAGAIQLCSRLNPGIRVEQALAREPDCGLALHLCVNFKKVLLWVDKRKECLLTTVGGGRKGKEKLSEPLGQVEDLV